MNSTFIEHLLSAGCRKRRQSGCHSQAGVWGQTSEQARALRASDCGVPKAPSPQGGRRSAELSWVRVGGLEGGPPRLSEKETGLGTTGNCGGGVNHGWAAGTSKVRLTTGRAPDRGHGWGKAGTGGISYWGDMVTLAL